MTRIDAQQDRYARSGESTPLLQVATRLYSALTEGAPAAGYHVRRGFAVRDAATKRPIRTSFTDTWLPAREQTPDGAERDRLLNPWVLAQHLRGRYDVAWTSPSWTSMAVLDIDRPALADDSDVDALVAANFARDEVLAAVWRAFDFQADRQPVCLSTPGGGYHLYLPFCRSRDPAETERAWPNQWSREWIEHVLDRAGLALKPGRLELYPSGVRLRAPCGRQMALLAPDNPDDPDDLRLQPVHARIIDVIDGKTGARTSTLRRDILPMTETFLSALEAARRPLEEWVAGEDAPSAWSSVWGPFGDRDVVAELAAPKNREGAPQGEASLFQHKEEVLKAPGAPGPQLDSDGLLLRGRAFYRRIGDLSKDGLTDPGSRHDGALKLAWYLGVLCNLEKEDVLARVRDWLLGHEHVSATRQRSPRAFVNQTLREVSHYYDTRIVRCRRFNGCSAPDLLAKPLELVDAELVRRVVPSASREAAEAILRFLHGHADAAGCVPQPVELSGKVLSTLCGDGRITILDEETGKHRRRAYVVAMEELLRLGILAMHTDYSTGNHGRTFTCWYAFGSGVLPRCEGEHRVLAERTVAEGTLRVLSNGTRRPPRVTLATPESVTASSKVPWWVRMYRRRAFTPAEFAEGDARKLLPGPFRHRFASESDAAPGAGEESARSSLSKVAPIAAASPIALPPGSLSSETPQTTDASIAQRPRPVDDLRTVYAAAADREPADVDWKATAYGSEARWRSALLRAAKREEQVPDEKPSRVSKDTDGDDDSS